MVRATTTDRLPASIGDRLARIVERLPGRTAIVEGDARVSYAELDAAASAIAGRIQAAQGARPGLVCLLFENKIPAIEAIFGAASCGCAYVPLDAGDPDERLRFILRDSEPVALITESRLLERARTLVRPGCAVIDIEAVGTEAGAGPVADVAAETLANVYYTSGSTGAPKGVCQTHRNVLYFADAYANTLRIGEVDRLSLLYTLSFSASMMDIFSGLLNGATLCAYDVRRGGIASLAEWLDRERISVLHCVPTVFRGLFSALAPERRLEHLRAIDLGGETVFDSDVELFRRHTLQSCILVNHLAATEANVIAQHVVEHRGGRAAEGILPVGRAPQGLRVKTVREDGSETDTDEVGSIVVSSAHVSPGYWQRPELGAAAFSTDVAEPGQRRYFTGDLGRIDPEGNLHFLGRKGSRIKIRGQSIDPSEVEAALAACPGVVKSAVIAVSDGPHSEPDKLVAYLVVGENAERNPLSIRRRLATRLPSYMMPSAFAFVATLPLTATGKIDRKALAATAPTLDRDRLVDPPRDDVERAVAELFQRLLKQTPVGRDDDFFMLGGDSLSLFEMQTRLLEQFGASLSKIHEDATVAGIAANIRRNFAPTPGVADVMPVLFPLRTEGSAPPLFIVHGRLGQAFISPHFMRLLDDDLPVWAFQARGLDGLQPPHATIEAMAADYVGELRRQRPEGPYFLAALCAGALIANEMARMLRDTGAWVLPLLLFDPPVRRRLWAAVTKERLLAQLQGRRRLGRFATRVDEPRYATAAVQTAMAFEAAIWKHEPKAYDGPVYMLSSRKNTIGADLAYLKLLFSGTLERLEVGTTHADALDPRNPAFAEHLARCLASILDAARQREVPANSTSTGAGIERRRHAAMSSEGRRES